MSKNGTFILDVPGRPDGTIDSKGIAVLNGITAWMQTNGEAIHETRQWKAYGEGPNSIKAGSIQGGSIKKLGEKDIRFTRNKANTVIYALVMGCPTGSFTVQSLGLSAAAKPGKIARPELLGTDRMMRWKQQMDALRLELPKLYKSAEDYAAVLKMPSA